MCTGSQGTGLPPLFVTPQHPPPTRHTVPDRLKHIWGIEAAIECLFNVVNGLNAQTAFASSRIPNVTEPYFCSFEGLGTRGNCAILESSDISLIDLY